MIQGQPRSGWVRTGWCNLDFCEEWPLWSQLGVSRVPPAGTRHPLPRHLGREASEGPADRGGRRLALSQDG